MDIEDAKLTHDSDDEIIILHETMSSPNLHSTSQRQQHKQRTKNLSNIKKQFADREIRLFMKAATDNDLQTVAHFCQRGMDIEVRFFISNLRTNKF